MLTLILCCDAGTGYLIGTASTVCCFLITDVILSSSNQLFFRNCCSFTSRKLYDFLETLLCFLHQSEYSKFHPVGYVLLNIAGNVSRSSTARYFEFDNAQRDKLPDYRGPLPDVFNCQSGTWPACGRVSPRSPQGAVRWETLGTKLMTNWAVVRPRIRWSG